MTPTELHVTAFALKRLFAIVHQHMSLQLIGVTEFAIANLTVIGTLASMNSEMTSQIGHLHKLTITVRAVIGLFAGMQTHMSLQMMITSKTLVALGAFEGLFAGVSAFMILQHMLIAKGARAYFAGKALIAIAILAGGMLTLQSGIGRAATGGRRNGTRIVMIQVSQRHGLLLLDIQLAGLLGGQFSGRGGGGRNHAETVFAAAGRSAGGTVHLH